MKILVLDNYDSFVYNLVHMLREFGHDPDIYRNDKITLDAVEKYDKILLSPGPGIPSEAGILMDIIKKYGATKSILGICLGHQAIGEVYGAKLSNMKEVLHGIATPTDIKTPDEPLFENVPETIKVARYHSWTVLPETVNEQLCITALDHNGYVMGLTHTTYDVRGLQFHPESILTEYGKVMMKNWLDL